MVAPRRTFSVLLALFRAEVLNRDVDTLVQVCQLAHALQQGIVVVGRRRENRRVGLEGDAGAGVVGVAHGLHLVQGFALAVLLLVDLAAAVHVHLHVFAQGVHAAHAHAVQAAAHLVAALVELAARMQHRHHHLQGRAVLLLVHVHGNAAPVVLHGHAVVLVDADVNPVAETRQSLVDGVVHHLIHQMVQAAEIHVADIHGRTHAHSLQTLQHRDITCTVFALLLCRFVHILLICLSVELFIR